jgi:hypothetical protein
VEPEHEHLWTQTNASAVPCATEWNCATSMETCSAVVVSNSTLAAPVKLL